MSLESLELSQEPASATLANASPNRSLTSTDLLGRVVSARDLDKHPCPPPPWLWQGYLGPGKVTLLTSQWKSGKTTLVSLLLARMQQGGQLAGLPVAAGRAFVISEESEADWRPRFEHLGIRDHVDLLCRPFPTQPSLDQWLALLETTATMHQRQGTGLVVIDSLASFLPAHSENTAGALLECLTPLQGLTAAGMSVLLPHHPRKGKTVPGQAARGSGALPSFVDIIIEMGYYNEPDDLDRRRRLLAFSRHEETPRHLLIELQADGTDYVVLQSGLEAALGDSWPAVVHVLTDACTKLTRQEILDRWPPDYSKPDSSTLWRWLGRAVAQGLARQLGTGRPGDPFRYWLPAREDLMRPDGGTPEEMEAWNNRFVTELFEKLELGKPTKPHVEATVPVEASIPADTDLSEEEDDGTESDFAASETATMELESPLPEPATPTDTPGADATRFTDAPNAPASPSTPDANATRLAETPDTMTRLPFPYNTMNPGDVPEEVWKRARAAQLKSSRLGE